MPWQLIYTSTSAGIVPGRSGFCTVARHREIPERLVTAIERISVYEPPSARIPIFTYRTLSLGNETYGIISRFCDAGLDYTSRRNYLAHHLIFTGTEMATLPPPAEIARRWIAWHSSWTGQPRWLDDPTTLSVRLSAAETKLPAETWQTVAGDTGHAATLCADGTALDTTIVQGVLDDSTLLRLFAESSLLLRNGPWSAGFTTCIQSTDTNSQIPWRVTHGTDGINLATLPPASPTNSTVRHARTGVSPEKQPRAAASPLLSPTKTPARQTTSPADNAPNDTPARHSSFTWLIIGIAIICTALLCFAIWQFLGKSRDTDTRPARPANAAQPKAYQPTTAPATPLAELYASNTLQRDLDTAIAAGKWEQAASLWKKFTMDASDTAKTRQGEYLPLIQLHLPKTLADSLDHQFDLLAPKFSETDRAHFRTALASAKNQLSDINATASAGIQVRIKRLEKQIALIDALPVAPPPLAFSVWENDLTAPGDHVIYSQLNAPTLRAFLNKKHAPLTLHAVAAQTWQQTTGAVEIPLTEAAFQPGKALFINPAPNTPPRVRFILDKSAGPVRLERAKAPQTTPLETLFDNGTSLHLTLTDGTDTTALLLLHPNKPPTPFRASLDLLVEDNDTVSLPAWLKSALQRFAVNNGFLILYPTGGADFAKDYNGTSLNRSTVRHALEKGIVEARTQIETLKTQIKKLEENRQVASDTADIDNDIRAANTRITAYQTRLQALDARLQVIIDKTAPLLRQGAPWTAGIVDQRNSLVLPLVIFE